MHALNASYAALGALGFLESLNPFRYAYELGQEVEQGYRDRCEYPWWCNNISFIDRHIPVCRPFTEVELRNCQRKMFGPAMPVDVVERSVREAGATTAAYQRMHPEEAARLNEARQSAYGDVWGDVGRFLGQDEVIYAALGLGALLLVRELSA